MWLALDFEAGSRAVWLFAEMSQEAKGILLLLFKVSYC